jgi:signal transduction histidine kinase
VSNAGSTEGLRELVDQLQDEVAELRRSRRRVAAAAHADRRAIERDLHDGVQQHLVALGMELQRASGLAERDSAAARAMLAEMVTNVREALDEASSLAARIYPSLLEGRGFAGALRSAATGAGVTAIVEVPGVVAYPGEILATLYWTWAEALSCAPAGSKASIKVLDGDDGLTVQVAIAGQVSEAELARLGDRIEALDGRFRFDEAEGGSRFQGWLPLPR